MNNENLIEQKESANAGCVRRLVRAITPRYHHMSGSMQLPPKVEYWKGDDQYRASLHFHWNWCGKCHWLCIFLPELP